MRWQAVVIAPVVALLTVSAIAAGVVAVDEQERALAVSPEECAELPLGSTGEASPAQEECFAVALAQALSAGDGTLAWDSLNKTGGSLGNGGSALCHKVSHFAGEKLWPSNGQWEEVVDSANAPDRCANGVLHGFLTAGFKAAPEESSAIVAWCDADPVKEDIWESCGHAIGHAAFSAFGDRVMVAQTCDGLSEFASRRSCAAGAVMDELAPMTSDPDALLDVKNDVGFLCRHIDPTDTSGLLAGCASGAGTGLVVQAGIRSGGGSYAPPNVESFEAVEDNFRGGITACLQFGKYASECTSAFLNVLRAYMPSFRDQWKNPIFVDKVCGAAAAAEPLCRQWYEADPEGLSLDYPR